MSWFRLNKVIKTWKIVRNAKLFINFDFDHIELSDLKLCLLLPHQPSAENSNMHDLLIIDGK